MQFATELFYPLDTPYSKFHIFSQNIINIQININNT